MEDLSASKKAILEDWFARSGALPLTLVIQVQPTKSIDEWHHIFKSSCTRWRRVVFFMLRADVGQLFAFKLPFHQLRSVKMVLPDSSFPLHNVDLDVFDNAPMLRRISIVDNELRRCSVKLPWHQVIHFRSDNCGEVGILEILRQCPNLLACELREVRCQEPLPSSPLQLPQLRDFAFVVQERSGDCVIVDSLVLPALETLTVDMNHNMFVFTIWYEALIGLLSRSRCPLRILKITGVQRNIPHSALPRCISLAPGLVELDINYPLGKDFVSQLTTRPAGNDQTSSFLLSKLERLSFDCGRQPDHRACVDMIRSRWNLENTCHGDNEVSRLRYVRLHFKHEPPEPEIISQVEELQAEGLNIFCTHKMS
jgi:hypothetical protein